MLPNTLSNYGWNLRIFFVAGPRRVGHNEIDILAVKLDPTKTSVEKKIHLESTVGGRPGGPEAEGGLAKVVSQKFESSNVREEIARLFGDDYERWIVVGKLPGGAEKQWSEESQKCGVRVIPFTQVVSEYIEDAARKNTPADEIGRLLDTLRCFGLLASSN